MSLLHAGRAGCELQAKHTLLQSFSAFLEPVQHHASLHLGSQAKHRAPLSFRRGTQRAQDSCAAETKQFLEFISPRDVCPVPVEVVLGAEAT